jgi:putative ABC transport system substrate-binding protein
MAREGGVVSYGVDLGETFPRAAEYIDRILGGAKPADLPVQAPTKCSTAAGASLHEGGPVAHVALR